jgi:hypothetical protein
MTKEELKSVQIEFKYIDDGVIIQLFHIIECLNCKTTTKKLIEEHTFKHCRGGGFAVGLDELTQWRR